MLNVGPKADGTIPDASIERLRAVGRWMTTNGQAIYGTTASPTRRPSWGRITAKAKEGQTILYLHVFDWPKDGKLPVSVTNEVVSCALLANAQRTFDVTSQGEGLVVNLVGEAPDPICSIVALTVAGPPKAVVYRIPQQADGQLVLAAVDAELRGGLQIEMKDDKPNIGFWVNSDLTAGAIVARMVLRIEAGSILLHDIAGASSKLKFGLATLARAWKARRLATAATRK